MQRKNKKKSLNREFTIMTMFTSVSALVLFGAVMLALFLFSFTEISGKIWKIR